MCLMPMAEREITEFAIRQFEHYLADRIASGEDAGQARKHAAWEWNMYFPNRVAAPGHRLYWLDEGAERLGRLWLGPSPTGLSGAQWIYYIEIDEAQRGKGFGRTAMQLAERDAVEHGATELGLNVFGDNTVAQRLYRSVGYRITAMNMAKKLGQTAE